MTTIMVIIVLRHIDNVKPINYKQYGKGFNFPYKGMSAMNFTLHRGVIAELHV